MRILVTGATGFIGQSFVQKVQNQQLLCCVRHNTNTLRDDQKLVLDLNKLDQFKDLYKEDFVKQYQIIIEESLQAFISGYQMSKNTLKTLLKPFEWKETNKCLGNKIYRRVVAILEKIKVTLNPKIYKAAELKLVDSLIKEFNFR